VTFGKRNAPVFGKRSPSTGLPDAPAAAEPSRTAEAPMQGNVLPDPVWEGEMSNFLRMLGMSPDDPSSLMPDANSVNARLARDREKHEARLSEINRSVAERVPGGRMRQFSLIPDSCWNGELGAFLMMRLGLFPYDDWNMIFLPADEKTADALDLPVHPNGNVPAFEEAAERLIGEGDMRLRVALAEAGRTQDFARFQDEVEEIREKVRGLAKTFLDEMDKDWASRAG
jgi:hypothetical protein